MKRIYLIALIAATMAGTTACGGKKTATVTEDERILVKTQTALLQSVPQTVEFTGNIQPYKSTFISPSFAARIDKINVEVGDNVRTGQTLVKMDPNSYNQSAVQLGILESDLARLLPVYEAGGVSKQQIDQLQAQIDVLKEATNNLAINTTLTAPFNGVVTGRYNEEGDLFTMGGNADGGVGILRIMQIDNLKVLADVQEQYLPDVKIGMPVTLKTDVYPDETFQGQVSLIYPAVNSATKTFTVEVKIPNSNRILRPGMYSRTIFDFGDKDGVTIDDLAVQKQLGTNDKFIYVIKDGVAERRIVTTGRQVGSYIEITSGLSAGEEVAVAGMSRLSNGAAVRVNNN